MADKTANYSVSVDSNGKAVGNEAADALARLKATIDGSQGALKDYSASLRQLRGSSDEIKSAKDELRAKIDAEKSAISAASLAILKQGTSYEQLARQAKKAEIEKRKLDAGGGGEAKVAGTLAASMAELGKPLASAKEGLDGVKGALGGLGGGASAALGPIGAIVAAITVVTGVAFAAASAMFDLTAQFIRWIVVSGDAARAAALDREAWTGSAQQAMALGHQIDALAAKVPTAKAELQKLSGELIRTFAKSYVGGQGIVDTFNIIAVASAAMGDAVGNQLGDIIKRAKDIGRVQIQPLDLRGTTIALKDVATELAKTSKMSVAQAEAALRSGGVKVDAAAAAMRAAVEKRFGEINARKLLTLDAISQKLRESFAALTKDVKLEPLLQGFKRLAMLFDSSTFAGQTLKKLIEIVGNSLGPAFNSALPIAEAVFDRLENGALRIIVAMLDARDVIRKSFSGKGLDDVDVMAFAMRSLAVAINGVTEAATAAIKIFGALLGASARVAQVTKLVMSGVGDQENLAAKGQAGGKNLIQGLIDGMLNGKPAVKSAAQEVANAANDGFVGPLQIKSPSRLWREHGHNLDRGAALGIDDEAERVQSAAERMAPTPASTSGGSPSSAAAPAAAMHFHFYVDARGASAGTSERLQSSDFLTQLIDAFEGALKTQGIPVGAIKVAA